MHMWLPLNSEAGKSATTKALHLLVLLLSSWLVVTLSIDTFRQVPFAERDCFTRMQMWVCLFFIFDFVVQWALAPNRWCYLSRHFIFLLVSIPYVELFSWFQVACSAELSYFLRLVPFVRSGYALAIARRLGGPQQDFDAFLYLSGIAPGYGLFFESSFWSGNVPPIRWSHIMPMPFGGPLWT